MKKHLIPLLLIALLTLGCQIPDSPTRPAPEGYVYAPEPIKPKLSFQPNFIPFKFSIDHNGISTSYTYSIATFIGTFGLTLSRKEFKKRESPIYKKTKPIEQSSLYERYKFDNFSVRDRKDVEEIRIGTNDIVVAIIKNDQNVDLFVISEGLELEIVTEGLNRTRIKDNFVEIDTRYSKIKELFIYEDSVPEPVYEISKDHFTRNMTLDEDIFSDVGDIVDLDYDPKYKEEYLTRHSSEDSLLNIYLKKGYKIDLDSPKESKKAFIPK